MKRNIFRLFQLFSICLIASCSNSLQDVDGYGDGIASGSENYKLIVKSKEYEIYNSECIKFIENARDLVSKLSADDSETLTMLVELYHSDHERYQSLLESHVADLVGVDLTTIEKDYYSLLDARSNLLHRKEMRLISELDKNLISMELHNNLIAFSIEDVIPSVKTRTEGGDNKDCLQLCKEQYDADIQYAYAVMACGTALNIIACVSSLGVSVGGSALTQLGLLAYYEMAQKKAKEDYDRCVRGCK